MKGGGDRLALGDQICFSDLLHPKPATNSDRELTLQPPASRVTPSCSFPNSRHLKMLSGPAGDQRDQSGNEIFQGERRAGNL